MDSKYVIKYYDCFLEDGKLNIVMQFAPNGTLHSRLHAQHGKALPEEKVWKIFIQALLGLRHVHSKKIIHRDIKSLNLFFDADDNVLVGDLGIAKVLSPNTMFARTIVGTPYYLSPELCEDKPYNEKSDVWALGVVLYEMCTGGKHPFDAQNEGALIRKIMKGVYPPLPAGKFSAQLSDMLKLCLTMDHRQRPDSAALLANTSLINRARSLGIDLDPDAKNVSYRPPASAAAACVSEEPKSASERPPLAEMAPPVEIPSWELPANPHLRQQMRPADVSLKRASQQVHYPGRPPAGYAGADDNAAYPPYADEQDAVAAKISNSSVPPVASIHVDTVESHQRSSRAATAREMHMSAREGSRVSASHSSAIPPPAQPEPQMMNSLQRQAAERKAARDIALANGRGNLAREAFVGDATDPFIAHQLAKLGVDEEKYQEAMRAAAVERADALAAAKANGRGGQLAGVMDGYGGESSFKARGIGDYYDEDYGEYYPPAAVAPAGAPKRQPAEPVQARERPAPAPRPYEVDNNDRSHYRTAAMEQSAAVRNAKYEAPSFGRRRAQDLMITGPSMRGSGPPSRGAGYSGGRVTANMGYAASMAGTECTTTVAPTSYYNA